MIRKQVNIIISIMEQGKAQLNRASTRSESNRPPSCWTNLVVQNNNLNPYSSQCQDMRASSCSESAQNKDAQQIYNKDLVNRNGARQIQKSVTNKFETDHTKQVNELTDINNNDNKVKSVAKQEIIDVSSSNGSDSSRANQSNMLDSNAFKQKSIRQSVANVQSPKNQLFPNKSARKQSQQPAKSDIQFLDKAMNSEDEEEQKGPEEQQVDKEAEGFSSHSSSSDASMQQYTKMTALNGEPVSQQEAIDEKNLQLEPVSKKQGWKILEDMDSLPLMKSGYSLEADMKFGWRPSIKGKVLPIPLVFDVEDEFFALDHYIDIRNPKRGCYPTIYQGWRPSDSLKLHKKLLANQHKYHGSEYPFKMPGELPSMVQKLLDQQMMERVGVNRNDDGDDRWSGMANSFKSRYESGEILQFDSAFECGNLDRVVMVTPNEYDLYMRPDTNVRGHHQWFYFKVTCRRKLGTVKFNIVNFTKRRSLYESGMKICYCNVTDKEFLTKQAEDKGEPFDPEMIGWRKGCKNIKYESSKLNRIIQQSYQINDDGVWVGGGDMFYRGPHFQQLSFTYDFNRLHKDETYFAYMFPYSFTRLTRLMKDLKNNEEIEHFYKDCTPLCKSLSGIDVPYFEVSSRIHESDCMMIDPDEFASDQQPVSKKKKIVIMTGRVHPGESNSSFMMEGFIKFILNPKNSIANDLRKRIIFKIVPCTNPDGVIAGNYRVSMSGNDLNRRYYSPHSKLHPVVCAVKKIFADIKPNLQVQAENQILAYIDMHGHSRKKNVFMYGPQFPIHDARYLRMRVLPKLMSEEDELFRFFSCKFRVQRSKEKTARVVLWRQFNVMNCFTLEASFHGFFNQKRETKDFLVSHFTHVGKMLANALNEYNIMKDEEIRHQREMRARREELRLLKQKAMQINPAESISKMPTTHGKKTSDNSQIQLEPPATQKSMLSPSASSEAIVNIDDQQPETNPQNKKINQLRKKLLKDQKHKKADAKTGHESGKQSHSKEANKKKFKLTKKFKEEDKDLPPKPKKKVSNPNEPEQDVEEQDDDSPYQAHRWSQMVDPVENLDEDQLDLNQEFSDTLQAAPIEKVKSRYGQRSTKQQSNIKSPKPKRNFADLFQEIQKDEALAAENDSDGDSSGNNSAGPDSIKGDDDDPYGSDDETNNALLQRIGEKILNVLNADLKVDMRAQNNKAIPAKDKKKLPQKPKTSQSGNTTNPNIKVGSQLGSMNVSANHSEKRPHSNARYVQNQKAANSAAKDQRLIGLGFNRRSQVTATGLAKRGTEDQGRPYSKQKGNTYQTAQVPLHGQYNNKYGGGLQSGQHYQGILLQLTNNNFNERIMSQPTYNKHKKNNKFGHFQGISGIHHLHSLTTNAHQMLQKQLQKVHAAPQNNPQPQQAYPQNPATAPANVGAISLSQQPQSKMSQFQVPANYGNKSTTNAKPINPVYNSSMGRMVIEQQRGQNLQPEFMPSQRVQDNSRPNFGVNTIQTNTSYPLMNGQSRQFASSNEVTDDKGLMAEASFQIPLQQQQRALVGASNMLNKALSSHQKSIDLTNNVNSSHVGPTASNSLTNSQAVSASKIIDFSSQNVSGISDQRLSELAIDNCNFVTNKLKQQQRQMHHRLHQQKQDSVANIKKPSTTQSNLHPHQKRINNLGFEQKNNMINSAGGSTQMGFFAAQQQQTKEMTIYGNSQKNHVMQQSATKLNPQASKTTYDDFQFFNTHTRTPQLHKHYPHDKYPMSSTEKERQASTELPKQLQRASYMTQKNSQLNVMQPPPPVAVAPVKHHQLIQPVDLNNRREPGSAQPLTSQQNSSTSASRGARFWQHQQRVLQSIQDKSSTNPAK